MKPVVLPFSSRLPSRPASLLLVLLLAPLLTLGAGAARAAPPTVRLQAAQIAALGVQVQAQAPGTQPARPRRSYPARVSVPTGLQRVVTAPLPARLVSQSVALGDTVRAGQVLAVLYSQEGQAWQREALQAGSQADLARRVAERDEQLFREGLIGRARLEASRAAQQQAQALAAERRRALAQAGAGSGLGGELVLRSPLAGVVLQAPATVGQRVEQHDVLFRIARLSRLWLELQVPVQAVGGWRVGDAVEVTGRGVRGRLIAIGGAVDEATQTVPVRAEVALDERAAVPLRPGEQVEATVEAGPTGTGEPALVSVPAAAVVRHAGSDAVFIEAAPGAYRLQPVQVRSSAQGRAAVAGLPAQARVVVAGTAALLALVQP